jgi:hypothetical protein
MAWESRNGRGRYYTRSHRENGRIVREYVGTGETAERIAALDAAHRATREAERAALRAEREAALALDAELASLHRTVDILTRGALLAAGFERHKRQWRKRRDDTSEHLEVHTGTV